MNIIEVIPPVRSFAVRVVLPLLFFAVTAVHAQTNLLTNGSFETGPYYTNGTVDGWHVINSGGVVDEESISVSDGLFAAALHTGSGSVIFQDFPTTLGERYHLSIAVGVIGNNDNQPTVAVDVFSSSGTFLTANTITPPTYHLSVYTGAGFSVYTYDFTADGTSADLSIVNTTLANPPGSIYYFDHSGGIVVDAVSLTVVPEPSTYAALALGIGATGLAWRSRR